ncbi:MAG: hypothetical protein ACM3WR_13830 [Solirubrobacterales bacterium]
MDPPENRPPPMGLVLASLLALVFALVSCGHAKEAAAPDTPADLPGFRPGPVSELSLDDVASDALDPAQLGGLLRANGFTGAAVRAFSAGMGAPVRTVRVEVVAFDQPAGARPYLDWLHEHAQEFLGAVRDEPGLDPPGAFVLSHAPDGCCSKEQPVWLVAWRHGDSVVWIQVIGQGIGRAHVEKLVNDVQASV